MPESARVILQVLVRALEALGTQLEELDAEVARRMARKFERGDLTRTDSGSWG